MKTFILIFSFFITTQYVLLNFNELVAKESGYRVVVIGEDQDALAIPRNNEIYKRVVSQIQKSLTKQSVTVIDESLISTKLGLQIPSRRSKNDILEMLQLVNATADASVNSRLLVLFSIIPNIQEMTMTRKLSVRVRGQIFDLQSLAALSSFEVKNKKPKTIPKKQSLCNELCVQEKVGEISGALGSELGDLLITNFQKLTKEPSFLGVINSGKTSLGSTFTVKFIHFSKTQALRLKKILKKKKELTNMDLLQSTRTSAIYSVSSSISMGDLEEMILEVMMDLNINIDQVNVESFGNELIFESSNP